MNIIVLMKRVPDLVEDLEVDDTGRALDTEHLKFTLNEFDDHALEEALLLKEETGGTVTALALDGDEVDKMLFTALAKGADRALKVTGPDPEGSSRALAGILGEALADQSPDLILTGVQAADDRDGQLAPLVAAALGLPSVEVVTSVQPGDGHVTLHKEYSGGTLAEFEVDLPAVLGIQAARQTPRYAPVSKVRQIQESTTLETFATAAGNGTSGVTVVEMTPPETGAGAQMLSDVEELLEVLVSKGVV
jgi:electron transfer flavoprotein beta subunit